MTCLYPPSILKTVCKYLSKPALLCSRTFGCEHRIRFDGNGGVDIDFLSYKTNKKYNIVTTRQQSSRVLYFSMKRVKSTIPLFHTLLVAVWQHLDRVHIVWLDILHQPVFRYGDFSHIYVAMFSLMWAKLQQTQGSQRSGPTLPLGQVGSSMTED
jgi:hypothetical protein